MVVPGRSSRSSRSSRDGPPQPRKSASSTLLANLRLQEMHAKQVEHMRETELAELRSDAEDLQRQLSEAREAARLKEFQRAGAAKEIDQLRCELARAQRECARAAEGCSAERFEQQLYADVQALEATLLSTRGELAHYTIKAQQAEEQAACHERGTAQLRGKLAELERAQADERDGFRKGMGELLEHHNTLAAELSEAVEGRDEAREQLRRAGAQLEEARKALAAARSRAEEDRRRHAQELQESQAFAAELEALGEQSVGEALEKEREVRELREQLAAAKQAAAEASTGISHTLQAGQEQLQLAMDLRKALDAKGEELQQAGKECARLRQALQAHAAELGESQERVRELEQRAAEENGRLAAKECREHRLASELRSAEQALAEVREELAQQQREAGEARMAADDARAAARRLEEDSESAQLEAGRAQEEAACLRRKASRADEAAARAQSAAGSARQEAAALRQQLAAAEAQTAQMAGMQCGVDGVAAERLAAEMRDRVSRAEQKCQQMDSEREHALTEVQRLLGEVADWKQQAECERQRAAEQATRAEHWRKRFETSEKSVQRLKEERRSLVRRANESITALNAELVRMEGICNDYRDQYEAVRQRIIGGRVRQDTPAVSAGWRTDGPLQPPQPIAPPELGVGRSPDPAPDPVAEATQVAEPTPARPRQEVVLRDAVEAWLRARMQAEGTTDIPVSMKALRAELQEQLGCDLSQRRAELKDICEELLDVLQQQGLPPQDPMREPSREELAAMGVHELRAQAKRLGVVMSGGSEAIRQRLLARLGH